MQVILGKFVDTDARTDNANTIYTHTTSSKWMHEKEPFDVLDHLKNVQQDIISYTGLWQGTWSG